MKAFFDRTEPYYLTREGSFDAVPVDVPEGILTMLDGRKKTLVAMEIAIELSGAPEDSAQDLTVLFVNLLTSEDDNGL